MKNKLLVTIALLLMIAETSCFARNCPAIAAGNTVVKKPDVNTSVSKKIVVDHTCIKLDQIPPEWIEKAKKNLHIAYGHTSHGSQITSGMLELTKQLKGPFDYKVTPSKDSLDLRDNPFGRTMDLGNPDNKTWAIETRKYLRKNKDINVVMWSWCGQLSKAGKGYVKTYINLMQALEKEFPKVTFVYMTGHLDGSGEKGTLAGNNKQIREFCIKNSKVLYDFADIESYNPNGVYYGNKYANDACEYDSNGDKKRDKNWAKEWQDSHTAGVDWFRCTAEHSQPVNANMKAYAAWWLMARIAGWDGTYLTESGKKTIEKPAEKANTVQSKIIGHTSTNLNKIPFEWIEEAKKSLHIAYGHTSHGSQITCGLLELTQYKKSPFIYKEGSPKDSLDLRDNPFEGQRDLGNPDNKTWAEKTRKYLEINKDINVVMWSWCGQLSTADNGYVENYLELMQALEKEFPKVTFVYMTGHLDGTGENGALARNNMQIREFCKKNNKVLYDFADIESYNPDGIYFGDKYANDACDYDSNGDKKPDRNWAKEWQDSHTAGVDWFRCTAEHSQPVNANMKAYAAWWLMAWIAGWDGTF